MDKDSKANASTFTPPRHWIGPQELEASYWSDKKTKEIRGQEFAVKPVEWIEKIDASPEGGFARRDFLTVMGASMAMASFACARRPVHKIIPYVVQPEEVTPGVPVIYASTSKDCPCGCGLLVKTREGRPIKLEGNPDHPINGGALCVRAQASVLSLYDPARLQGPVARSRDGKGRKEINWSDADTAINDKLRSVASGSGKVRVLSDVVTSSSTSRLINEFTSAFSAGQHVQYNPLAMEEIADGQGSCYGTTAYPAYHFDRAELVVSVGADFLGSWLSPTEHAGDWAKSRKLDSKNPSASKFSKLVVYESSLSLTGSNADERYPTRPGDELAVVMAILHELVLKQGHSSYAGEGHLNSILASYDPGALGTAGVLNPEQIRALSTELWAKRGKGLVVAGGISTANSSAIQLQIAVNLLNSILENEGATIDGTVQATPVRSSFGGLHKLINDMKNGNVEVLVLYRTNPAYYLSKSLEFEEALKKVPFVIAISDREDETAQHADFVLPDHHYLENWGDANPRHGLHSLQQPTIAPIHNTRAFEDSLITWIKGASLRGTLAKSSNDWHEYLKNHWKETFYRGMSGSFDEFWDGCLRRGVFETAEGKGAPRARNFASSALANLQAKGPRAGGETVLVLYSTSSLGDGTPANNPWLQELPDPISSVTWDNYLAVGPELAKTLSLVQDEVVQVQGDGFDFELPVYVQPGMHPNAVAAAVGYGRAGAGKVGDGAGVNLFPLAKVFNSRPVFSGFPVKITKTQKFYRLAVTQWHTASENRPILNDIPLALFQKNPGAAMETDPELRLETVPSIWPVHEYKGHRWGMTIDMTSCIGCSACMIACQAENNIPVVGRDQVRMGRNMHWIRIDRYYSGNPDDPSVIFQPMLCQHCENAPCETVCPVLATVHDDEGVNIQVYNRCVGTRYCQNNCPYKVRRFNFFDHWKSYEGTMNLAWNPDVTVRTRGIMEKCTFCVQRMVAGKDKAKDRGERLRDGEIQTACQQTCPTQAIVFGDMNDPESRVSKLRNDPRAFRALETLNTKPSVSYLTKVRNVAAREREEGAEAGKHS